MQVAAGNNYYYTTGDSITSLTVTPVRTPTVPEPASWTLVLAGLCLLVHRLSKRPAAAA